MSEPTELTPEQRASSIYVHIVESPDMKTLKYGTYEGGRLHDMLELAGITSEHYLVENKDDFKEKVSILPDRVLDYKEKDDTKLSYILHISAHGNEEGIFLTDGSSLDWKQLVDIVAPVNTRLASFFNKPGTDLEYPLVVVLSSCMGLHGFKMTLNKDDIPFRGIFGPEENVSWMESSLAYLILYHQHAMGLNQAFEISRIMSEATGKKFTYAPGTIGEEIKKRRSTQ